MLEANPMAMPFSRKFWEMNLSERPSEVPCVLTPQGCTNCWFVVGGRGALDLLSHLVINKLDKERLSAAAFDF